MSNFLFLQKNIERSYFQEFRILLKLINFQNLHPTIYFSISLKEQLKYIFDKKLKL